MYLKLILTTWTLLFVTLTSNLTFDLNLDGLDLYN